MTSSSSADPPCVGVRTDDEHEHTLGTLGRGLVDRGLGALGVSAAALVAVFIVGVVVDGILRSSLERNLVVLVANPTAWALLAVSASGLAIRSRLRQRARRRSATTSV